MDGAKGVVSQDRAAEPDRHHPAKPRVYRFARFSASFGFCSFCSGLCLRIDVPQIPSGCRAVMLFQRICGIMAVSITRAL
jgi:hypothetical protein